MTLRKTESACVPPRPVRGPAGLLGFALLAAVGTAPAVLLLLLAPLALFLPALGIMSFAIACGAALFAYGAGTDRRAAGATAWDVAALFAMIWVLSGLMCGARPLAALFTVSPAASP